MAILRKSGGNPLSDSYLDFTLVTTAESVEGIRCKSRIITPPDASSRKSTFVAELLSNVQSH